MQFIFVIHVARRICQGNRLSGSLDGVKNTPTLSHLFFTRSQLSPYISRFASGYRFILATALFLCVLIGFQNKVIGQVITGANVDASSLTCGTAPLMASGGIIYVGDGISATTLNINSNIDLLTCLGGEPIQFIVRNFATINFSPSNILTLPPGSAFVVQNGGKLNQVGSCASSERIYIGTDIFASCTGNGGADNKFPDIEFLPLPFYITSVVGYCSGGAGVPIELSGSEIGVKYQLQIGGVNKGAVVSGTGASISFGNQAAAGTYTVIATNAITPTYMRNMLGSVILSPKPNPTIEFTLGAHDHTYIINTVCGEVVGGGQNDLDIDTGDPGGSATYQWQVSYDNESTWVNAPGPTSTSTQYKLDPLYTIYESVADVYFFRIVITNNQCFGISNSIKLTVTQSSNLTAGTIAGDQSYCNTDPPITTEVTVPTGGSGPLPYTYKWQSSTDNIIFSDIGGAGTTGTTYNPAKIFGTRYYRRIVFRGNCLAKSNVITITVNNGPPATPGVISGQISACKGVGGLTYSIAAIPNTASYIWTTPADWTITAGQGTKTITATAGNTSGDITVKANNICGTSATASTLPLVINPLPTITGSLNVCVGSTTLLLGSETKNPINPWVSDNPSFATVDNSGLVTGVAEGTSIITYTNDNGCRVSATVSVTPPVGTPVFTIGPTSSRNQGVETITYKATATNSTGITYTLSPASAGTFIESAAGLAVTYSSLWNGTCTITATATGCGGSKSEIHTVSTNWCYALFTVNGALSCAGASSIDGHIGTLVGAITGFTPPGLIPPGYSGPGILSPSSRLDPQATTNSVQAAAQVVTAYNDLAAMPCGPELPHPPGVPIDLTGPITLTPNVYCSEGAITVKGEITLDGAGIYIFKINGALTTDGGSTIELKNGADYRNVYWIVYGAVVLNDSKFVGTIINDGAITLNTNAELNGRALSISGAIALTTNKITSNCYPLISIPDNTIPTFVPPGDITECVENIFTAVYNSATIDINPDRPDYYTFSHGDIRLNLDPASFIDNPDVPGCTFEIRWKIDMNDGTQIPALPSSYNIGQPSAYGDIKFLGDGIGDGTNFSDVTHTITYWIVDCAGNVSLPQTRTITIKPRPYIQKTTI